MRICILSREYPPETGFGGIATFAENLAVSLVQLGQEVEVVSLATEKPSRTIRDGVTIHRVKGDGIADNLSLFSSYMPYTKFAVSSLSVLWQKFLELHERNPFDVIDTPEMLAEGLFPGLTKCAPLLVRLYTPHSKLISDGLVDSETNFDHEFLALLERLAMISADVITCPSEDLASFVSRDLGYPNEDIHIVRNPLDTDLFCPEGPKKLDKSNNLKVLFVGRLEKRKGISYLFDAIPKVLKEFPAVDFYLIGRSDKKNKLLQKMIGSFEPMGNVHFLDHVPLEELPAYYRAADVTVVPSLYDNSPYACLEAMSCGCPVVGTSSGGTREYVIDGKTGLIVPSRDGSAIASALVELLKDSSKREKFSKAARDHVVSQYQRKNIAEQTLKLYEVAIDKSKQPERLYLKDKSTLYKESQRILSLYNQMLHEGLCKWSWRYRFKNWRNQFLHRPKLSVAKLFLQFANMIYSPESGRKVPETIQKLETSIRLKSLSERSQIHPKGARDE